MKIKPKVGVVSCSGECCGLGTLSRVATRLVLEHVKPYETVTICLPLFLAGGPGEREFAKEHPTISVDGCGKRCAEKAIEKYSGRVACGIDIEELLRRWRVAEPTSRRELIKEEIAVAWRLADEIGSKVDQLQKEAE